MNARQEKKSRGQRQDGGVWRRLSAFGLLLLTLPGAAHAQQETKLQASDRRAEADFGAAVALEGDRLLVGAPRDHDFDGAAYFFELAGGLWQEVEKLTVPGNEATFGRAVSLDGDRALVGTNDQGAYVIERQDDGWEAVEKLTPSDGAPNGMFGRSVFLDGATAMVGAYGFPPAINTFPEKHGPGTVYVFEEQDGDWAEVAELPEPGDDTGAFGMAIAVDGDRALVGAPAYLFLGEPAVYVYERLNGEWELVERLDSPSAGDSFGYSLALEGDRALIGAFDEDGDEEEEGAVYVYERLQGEWQQVARLTASDAEEEDRFGWSVDLDGARAVIGTDYRLAIQSAVSHRPGAAYVFESVNGVWQEVAKLMASDGQDGDFFGIDVSLDGDRVVVGAVGDDEEGRRTGAAYVYELLNQQPAVQDDQATTSEEGSVNIDVLANDADPDGDTLALTIVTAPAHGIATLNRDGTIMYSPEPDFYGEDSFTYAVDDNRGGTAQATVMVTVAGVNDAPSAAVITSPEAGAEVMIGGGASEDPADPEEEITIVWAPSTDAEGSDVSYTWQLSANEAFTQILFEQEGGEDTEITLTLGEVAALLALAGIDVGDEVTLYHRVVATDGEAETVGEAAEVTLVRGTLVANEGEGELPRSFALHAAYPNPFNPETAIPFDVAQAGPVRLAVYDMLGREVAVLEEGEFSPGKYSARWEAGSTPSGVYLVRMEAAGQRHTQRVVVAR